MEGMNRHTTEIAELQKQLDAKDVKLLQRSAKHSELTNKLNRVKLQSEAGSTVLEDRKSVGGNCERPNNRARVARQCKESYSTSPMAVFFALPAGRGTTRAGVKRYPSTTRAFLD